MSSVADQFSDADKAAIATLFHAGKTLDEIGLAYSKPRRTIGKLCKALGLQRDHKQAAAKLKSPIDTPAIVGKVREWRSTKSLEEIATALHSSVSAVQRLCDKYQITPPDNYNELQACRMEVAWTEEKRAHASMRSQQQVTPELRKKLSENSKELWRNGKYRRVQAEHRAKQSWAISSIQTHLYEILDDLDIAYYREYEDKPNDPETVIGPYNFDCAIPRSGMPTLLVECHGDYWHSLNKAVLKDTQKQSYIANNFQGRYELKCIWEHEFKCREKVLELLKYWLGIGQLELVDFDLKDVTIAEINVKTANRLLEKYHYLSGCGRGGIMYGAFCDGKLVAVCAFSSLVRQNLPYERDSTRELSRFCIHPRYQKKNFGSWMVSRCLKLLPAKYTTIVSYCDTTFNHDGALYKATNFTLDGMVRPDYWYVNEEKWVMHKKTLYQHAVKMSMTEAVYAERFGYKKVFGTEKLRFIFKR